VSWNAQLGRWKVTVSDNDGKPVHGGYFYDEAEAARVAAELRGELQPYALDAIRRRMGR